MAGGSRNELRSRAIALAMALCLVATACASTPQPSPITSGDVAALAARLRAPFTDDGVAAGMEAFAGASIQTFPDDLTTTTPLVPISGVPSPLDFARFQVRNMALEVASGSGITGAQIDGVAPIPAGGPPTSYLLVAYAQSDTTFGARLSAELLKGQPLDDPTNVVFPTLVISTFVSDLALAQKGAPATRPAVRPAALVPDARTVAFDPCGALNTFIDGTLNKIADAISSGVSGSNVLVKILVNIAVTLLLRKGLSGLKDALLNNPIVKAITTSISALAIVATIVGSLRDWSVAVSRSPSSIHYAVEGGPLTTGRIEATVNDPGGELFAPQVRSCADTLNITLPKAGAPGSAVDWTFTDGIPGHATQLRRDDVVPESRVVSMDYAMAVETANAHAKGQLENGGIGAVITIERQDRTSLKTLIDQLVDKAGLLKPAMAGVANEVKDRLDALAVPTGFAFVFVTFHDEPEPTPPPGPSPTPTRRPTPLPSPNPTGGPDPCASGCAQSLGDTHLTTVNDAFYDFQDAGEYTLLRSPDGTVEIQARETPFPDSTDVSINTALAFAVNGHRVSMYQATQSPSGSPYTLHVDGAEVPATATVDLGGGAHVAPLARGIEVAFPDGTLAWAFPGAHASYGLDLTVAPSAALKAGGTGLMGPVPPGSEYPRLPDGTTFPESTDHAARFDQLYHQLASAWHVTDQDSLFDYQTGQSTASFTVAGFPTPDLPLNLNELQVAKTLKEIRDAAAKCSAVQGTPNDFQRCLYDTLATDDPQWAGIYVLNEQFLADGPATLEQPEATPGPTATTTLPATFFQVASDLAQVPGVVVGPDGTLYLSLVHADDTKSISAIDPTTGEVRTTISTNGAGRLLFLDESVWAAQDDSTGSGSCSMLRLDPATLETLATIPMGCDLSGISAVAVQDGVWWVDRDAENADGTTGQLRHTDPQTNTVNRSVELPFLNGGLTSSATTVIYGDPDPGQGYFRLLPGAAALTLIPVVSGPFAPPFAAGQGIWEQIGGIGSPASEAGFFTTSATPDRTVPIGVGLLVGADESAVYVSQGDTPEQLWRYPIDGSAPSMIAAGADIQTADGGHTLEYFDNDPLFIGSHEMVKLWVVQDFPTSGTSALIEQAAALP